MVKFNKQQQQAIDFHKGACAVIAGAGSGKSTVLVNRIKNLIEVHNVPQEEILAISFTKNTADELKNKLTRMGYPYINIGTFHSVCGRILVQEGHKLNGNLIQEWQTKNCIKAINRKADVDDIMNFISYQKNYLRTYNDSFVEKHSAYTDDDLRSFYREYESFKITNGLYDFDDYLIKCYDVLKNNKGKYTYDFILVDEHQDSNLVQNMLLKELCQSGNIFCVFDYRQAIYSFRGGNTEYCMNFEKDWNNATVINMDINYRSMDNIVSNANEFIKRYYGKYEHYSDSVANNKNVGQIKLNTYYDRESEGIEVVDKIEKLISNGSKLNEISVLYRLNSNVSHVENELKVRGIDYEITNDSSFFKRKEIDGIISYLRLINNLHDDDAFERIFKLRNYPLAFFSNSIFDDIKVYSGLHNLSLYESFLQMRYEKPWQTKNVKVFNDHIQYLRMQKDKEVHLITLIENVVKAFQMEKYVEDKYDSKEEVEDRLNSIQILKSFVKGNTLESFITYAYSSNVNSKKKKKENAVKLMSVHSSKGLEFENVFLIGVEDGKFPHERSELLEEARLFYVATTRSKDNLFVSQIGEGNQFIKEYFNK